MTFLHINMQYCRFTFDPEACTLAIVVRIHELLFLSILKSSGSRTTVRLSAREGVLFSPHQIRKSAGSRPALFLLL